MEAAWWRRTGSNRRPQACKARALPTELRPRVAGGPAPHPGDRASPTLVGRAGFEPATSRLSSARSNQLSYQPGPENDGPEAGRPRSHGTPPRGLAASERKGCVDGGREGHRPPLRRFAAAPDPCRILEIGVPAGTRLTAGLGCRRWRSLAGASPRRRLDAGILRKEVIQPQVPLRLPCYDFTPVADPTVAGCLLAVSNTVFG